jgi:hypothetical protein
LEKETLMPFLPVRTFMVKSLAKPADIAAALKMHVQPLSMVNRFEGHKAFFGSVSEYDFRLIRVGKNRNPFRPAASGALMVSPKFIVIRVTIQHDVLFFAPLAIAFLFYCLLSVSTSALPLVVAILSNNFQDVQRHSSLPYLLLLVSPIALLAIGYILSWAAFESEANHLEGELTKIFVPLMVEPFE